MRLASPEVDLPLRFNVAPTQSAPVAVFDEALGGMTLRSLRWGLVPPWAKDLAIGNSLINARAETADSKPAFRAAFKSRRCIVPISGFYEWETVEGQKAKRPHYLTPAGEDLWLTAGLWESWKQPEGAAIQSYAILTTVPNELLATFHDRMPVILDPEDAARWAGPCDDPASLNAMLRPYPSDQMVDRLVSTVVNSPRNDSPECIRPAESQGSGGIFDQDP